MGVELRPRAFLRHWPKLSGGLLRRQPEANPCLTRIQAQDLEADGFEPFATHQDQRASPTAHAHIWQNVCSIYALILLPHLSAPKILTHVQA